MNKNLQTTFHTRQFMIEKNFELYYYQDTNPLTIAPHTHPYYEIYFFLDGKASFQIEKEHHNLAIGDIVIIPPNITHHATPEESAIPYRRIVFWVNTDYMEQLAVLAPSFQFFIEQLRQPAQNFLLHNEKAVFNTILQNMIPLIEELQYARYGREDIIDFYAKQLLLLICRMMYEKKNPPALQQEQSLAKRVSHYVNLNLESTLTLDCLAREFFVSKYHLSHSFKEEMGLSVHQYVMKKRLLAIKGELLTSEPLGELCIRYGFNDYPRFYRAFRKEFGVSPQVYRAELTAHAHSREKELSQPG